MRTLSSPKADGDFCFSQYSWIFGAYSSCGNSGGGFNHYDEVDGDEALKLGGHLCIETIAMKHNN